MGLGPRLIKSVRLSVHPLKRLDKNPDHSYIYEVIITCKAYVFESFYGVLQYYGKLVSKI